MERVDLIFEELSVPFVYTSRISHEFYKCIKDHISKKVVIVTDNQVNKLYVNATIDNLDLDRDNVITLSSPPGEQLKCIRTVYLYLNSIYEWGVDRSSTIICLGGGIPGNLGGLIAGLIYRGITLIHIPTTILAAFDSVISLKQAVNSDHAKNAIGLYHTPTAIYSSIEFFTTLSLKDIRSGICETIKNTLAILPSEIPRLSMQLNNALYLHSEAINLIKDISIQAKQMVMRHDKFEKKKALILEYGHTVGHVIELLDSMIHEHSITHGEAIGIGMLVEAEISYNMGYLSKNDLDVHYDMLSKIKVYPKLPSGITIDQVIAYLKKDNKRGYIPSDDNHVGMILLKELGVANGNESLPITLVPIKMIQKILRRFL